MNFKMPELEAKCSDCRNLLVDEDFEAETIACEKGYFNFTLYPNEVVGNYVDIENTKNGSCPCKGKSFAPKISKFVFKH